MDKSQAEREARRYAEGRERVLELVMTAEAKGKTAGLPYTNYLVRSALEALVHDIHTDIVANGGARAFAKYALYLGTIDPKIAALRAIQGVLGVLLREGGADAPVPIWKKAAYAAGQAVYAEYLMVHFKELDPAMFNSLLREFSRSMTSDERHVLSKFKTRFNSQGHKYPTWDMGDVEKLGHYILERLVANKFLETWTRTEKRQGRVKVEKYLMLSGELRDASLSIMEKVAETPRVSGALIEPPLDWNHETNTGGGFHTPDMQRTSAYAIQGRGPGPVAAAPVAMLNTLQRTAWRVNAPLLKAVRALSLKRDFGAVISPDPGPKPEFLETFTEAEKKAWKAQAKKWYTDKKVRAVKHLRAQRVFQESQELSQYPSIWFAYYADFRGRAYARSASLSPQGSDLEKGLLTLLHGKPVSGEGVTWFKSAGANRFGLDKVTLEEQLAWVDEQDAFLIRMGEDPLTYTEWADADSPVQFLAWCMEYAAWRKDPDGFLSHLPMGQDGTCNGLQNYSALTCDATGGCAVNLVPSDKPRDIYTDVASAVTKKLEAQEPSIFRDGWLAHGIGRKLTKRPTMTLPYGSTRYAVSHFIVEYIEDTGTKPLTEISPDQWGDAANWLSHVVWGAMGDVVGKAMDAMKWIQGWAKHAVENGHRVAWTAPSGLRVHSTYEGMQVTRVTSVAFKNRIQLYKPSGKPDMRKTSNAVAPNFVHSLDASHMTAVVLRAAAEGIEVVAIHDDFGTHAADTPRFREIIREEFIRIYQDNTILEDLAAATGYPVPPPKRGTLDIRTVVDSRYFFF